MPNVSRSDNLPHLKELLEEDKKNFDDGFKTGEGWAVAVRAGRIAGISDYSIIGQSDNITSTEEVISGTPAGAPVPDFIDRTAPTKVTVSSDNANDFFGGAGVNVVEIEGLLTDGTTNFELIFMAGQTPVESTFTYLSIQRIISAFHGLAPFENLGNIFVSDSADTFIAGVPQTRNYCCMKIGMNISHTGLYMVPARHLLIPCKLQLANSADISRPITLRVLSRPITVTGFLELGKFRFSNSFSDYDLPYTDQPKEFGQLKFQCFSPLGPALEAQLYFECCLVNVDDYITKKIV